MANYIKQLKDSEEVNGIFPISVAQAIYTSDMSTTVDAKLGELEGDVAEMESSKAPLASPVLTGTPTAPTPATADNSTKIATTAFVQAVVADLGGGGRGSIVVSAEQPVDQEVGGLWYKLLN